MPEKQLLYSIQSTYILNHVLTPEREIVTCNQRIDIPTIEPLSNVQPVSTVEEDATFIPCIELVGEFLSEFNLTFETNEGVTVLPLTLYGGDLGDIYNPYMHNRYVLVLPRGATGVKSCKLIHKTTGKEVQHNFTFGIMPPPYNYDNALFGYLSNGVFGNTKNISKLENSVITAFRKLQQGLYELQVQNSRFPMNSTPIPENSNLSMIKFRVTNKTGAKASLELEFTYRTADNSKGNDMFALPIADGDNSVIIDIDKGTITTISDSTAELFMISFPAKYGDHVITALNKASITGDTTEGLINYTYYVNPYLKS